jgi:hypothetical protein
MYLSIADTHRLQSGILTGHLGAHFVHNDLALIFFAHTQQGQGLEHPGTLVSRMLLEHLVRLLEGLLVISIVQPV